MEPDVSQLLTVQQAIEIIDSTPVSLRTVRLPLEQADGLRLAGEIVADRDYPPFDKSLMDGFAVRSADGTGESFTLRRVGEVAAGALPDRGIGSGECMAIYTGAPLPEGADAVVPVELVRSRSGDSVTFGDSVKPAQHIARRGDDCRSGRVLLSRGQRLSAAAIAVAASVGAAEVEVFARPRAVTISGGNELVPVDALPHTAQIRNSNGPMMAALLRRFDCDARDLGWVKDDPKRIRDRIESALNESDVLFITGGMSMGEYDFVPRVLGEMGIAAKITRLKIKPGKPFVFGVREPMKFVFGLPGNPVSALVCTVRLCARLLSRLGGGEGRDAESWIAGRLSEALPANGPREFYQPAQLNPDGSVTPLAWKGSADIYTLAAANALLVRPANEGAIAAGTDVKILQLPV